MPEVLLAIFAGAASVAWADSTPPRPLPDNPGVEFPEKASRKAIDGAVHFRVTVSSEGRVTHTKILGVPEWHLGFEDAATMTLSMWRFEPGTADGIPTEQEYQGTFDFILKRPRSHARMYAMSSDDAWRALKGVLDDLGFKPKVFSGKRGVFVTDFLRFSQSRFPGLSVPDQVGGLAPRDVEIHLFVPRSSEPARLYINTKSKVGRDAEKLAYNLGFVENWLFDLFEQRGGKFGHAIPYNPLYRDRLVQELAGNVNTTGDCPSPAIVYPGMTEMSRPELIARTKFSPDWPGKIPGHVLLQAIVYEDGSVARVEVVEESGDPRLAVASAHTISFWRYVPARVGDCAVATYHTVLVDYRQFLR